MTYQNYEFTAFTEADLLSSGDNSISCGDTFTMSGSATTCISVSDNDSYLSGDSCYNENSNDNYGQQASIEGSNGEQGNGGQIYAESYFWVHDQNGNWYIMIEIEQEGSSDSYFTFYTGGDYTMPAEGTALTVHSECNVTSDWIDFKCLDAGEKEEPAPTGAICGRLTEDADCDNTEVAADGSYDEGLAGQQVELYGWNGSSVYLVATTTTNADGSYDFPELESGWYYVQFPQIEGGEFAAKDVGVEHADSDANVWGQTDWICLEDGQVKLNVDASVKFPVETGSISGTVFCDINCDGLNGSDVVSGAEPVKEGVEIKLIDADGNVIETTYTDADGNYAFNDVPVGDYKIMGVAPDGTEFTIQDAGSDDSIDSDVDSNGMSNTVTVTADGNTDIDLGLKEEKVVELGALEGRYFCDENGNNVDDGEAGVANATVWLLSGNTIVGNTTTDENGNYRFDDLEAGNYRVRFEDPNDIGQDGKVFVDPNVGNDQDDSDVTFVGGAGHGNVLGVTVVAGETTSDVDAGIKDPGTAAITGRYFCDENDNDVDDGEPGIEGATVTLLDASGNAVLDANGNPVTTTTDANGNYAFTGLTAGTYGVLFAADADGKTFVSQDDPNSNGDDSNDSDVDDNGVISTITVGIGETSENNDAGVEDPGTAAIGDKVFLDLNGNGQQDAGEDGVEGVGIIVRDADGNIVGTDTTDAQGMYLVDGLDAGTYTVEFEEVDGFDFTTANQGDDASDSDADQTTGVSGPVTVGIGETNLTVDAGLVVENADPEATDDEGMVCATETVSINVLANDSDPDGDTVSVAHVNGEELAAGESTTLDSGAVVTLNADGTLSYDSANAVISGQPVSEILIGDTALDSFTYSITDGNGGTATGEVSVTLKGGLNTVETIATNLPTSGNVTFSGHNIGTAYTATLSGTGEADLDGLVIEAAYCIERHEDYFAGRDVTVDISGALDNLQDPADFTNDVVGNLDLINWIINQDFTSQSNGDTTGAGAGRNYTDAEVQAAIWGLTDGNSALQGPETVGPFYNGTQANAEEIIALAQANGEDYVPGEGDMFALVLNPTETQAGFSEDDDFDQAFIIALSFDDFKEECVC